jgi:hypothetical protein
MNLRPILTLALSGLIIGLLSLFGLTRGIEPFLWLFIALGSAWWLAKSVASRPFLHGLFAGFLMGIGNSVMQSLFIDSYIASNPEAAQGLQQIPGNVSPRFFVLMVGPIIGMVYGLCLGLLTLLAIRLRKRASTEPPAS